MSTSDSSAPPSFRSFSRNFAVRSLHEFSTGKSYSITVDPSFTYITIFSPCGIISFGDVIFGISLALSLAGASRYLRLYLPIASTKSPDEHGEPCVVISSAAFSKLPIERSPTHRRIASRTLAMESFARIMLVTSGCQEYIGDTALSKNGPKDSDREFTHELF